MDSRRDLVDRIALFIRDLAAGGVGRVIVSLGPAAPFSPELIAAGYLRAMAGKTGPLDA
jgi:hypothetical protein